MTIPVEHCLSVLASGWLVSNGSLCLQIFLAFSLTSLFVSIGCGKYSINQAVQCKCSMPLGSGFLLLVAMDTSCPCLVALQLHRLQLPNSSIFVGFNIISRVTLGIFPFLYFWSSFLFALLFYIVHVFTLLAITNTQPSNPI